MYLFSQTVPDCEIHGNVFNYSIFIASLDIAFQPEYHSLAHHSSYVENEILGTFFSEEK